MVNKTFWTFLFLLSLNSLLIGQSAVKFVPEAANGYLVLDKTNMPTLGHWECDLWHYFRNDSSYLDSNMVVSLRVTDDYLYFPPEVYEAEGSLYLMNLRFYDRRGRQMGSENRVSPNKIAITPDDISVPFNWDPGELKCEKKCNGRTVTGWYFPYAWAIKIYEKLDGTWYYSLRQAYRQDSSGNNVPYYAYYPASNFYSWYNASACSCTNQILGPLSGGIYKDLNGYIINEATIAVEKDAGPWGQQGGMRAPAPVAPPATQPTFALSSSPCNFPKAWFIDQMNTFGGFAGTPSIPVPNLICVNAYDSPVSSGSGLPHTWMLEWLEDRTNDLLSIYIWWADSAGGGTIGPPVAVPMDNMWHELSEMEDKIEIGTGGVNETDGFGPGGVGDNISEIIDRVLIQDVLNPGTTTVLDMRQLYDAAGGLIAPSGSLPAGLYRITVAFADGELMSRVVEATTGLDFTYEQSEMIQITASPNPITNNDCEIVLDASYTGSTTYQLIDVQGDQKYTAGLDFTKDQQATFNMDYSALSLEPGIYYHTFQFEDGSNSSIPVMVSE